MSCPFHPPSIRPISSSGVDKAVYFLLSNVLISQSISIKIFKVFSFCIARRTNGNFSCLFKKVAAATDSIISINRISIFCPKEYF